MMKKAGKNCKVNPDDYAYEFGMWRVENECSENMHK